MSSPRPTSTGAPFASKACSSTASPSSAISGRKPTRTGPEFGKPPQSSASTAPSCNGRATPRGAVRTGWSSRSRWSRSARSPSRPRRRRTSTRSSRSAGPCTASARRATTSIRRLQASPEHGRATWRPTLRDSRAILPGAVVPPLALGPVHLLLALQGGSALSHDFSDAGRAAVAQIAGRAPFAFLFPGANPLVTGLDHVLFLVGVIFFLFELPAVVVYVA